MSDPLYDIRLLSRDRLRPFHPEECESESDKNKQESDKNKQESENGEQSGSSSRYFQLSFLALSMCLMLRKFIATWDIMFMNFTVTLEKVSFFEE